MDNVKNFPLMLTKACINPHSLVEVMPIYKVDLIMDTSRIFIFLWKPIAVELLCYIMHLSDDACIKKVKSITVHGRVIL